MNEGSFLVDFCGYELLLFRTLLSAIRSRGSILNEKAIVPLGIAVSRDERRTPSSLS